MRFHEIRTISSFDFISCYFLSLPLLLPLRRCFHFFFPFGLVFFIEWMHYNSAYVNSSYVLRQCLPFNTVLLVVPFLLNEQKNGHWWLDWMKHSTLAASTAPPSATVAALWLTTHFQPTTHSLSLSYRDCNIAYRLLAMACS